MNVGVTAEHLLEALPGATQSLRFRHADGTSYQLELQPDETMPGPELLDGWVAAVWPMVLRHGGRLRVAGALSRNALRNFIEMGEAWANWRPREFRAADLVPDSVVDGTPPPPDARALLAWSGSLRSTHALIRHAQATDVRPFKLTGVLRVWGLHRGEEGQPPASALEPARRVLAEMGLSLTVVRVRHVPRNLLDPAFGDLPWVAAALHRVSKCFPVGLHARRYAWSEQVRVPRPEPVLSDLWSGDSVVLHATGGADSPVRMLQELQRSPALMNLVSNCERHPRHAPACGRCRGCRWFQLARHAAGVVPPGGPQRRAAVPRLDARVVAEAEAIHRDWAGGHSAARDTLAARLARYQRKEQHISTLRWLGSALGVSRRWPR